MSTFKIVGRKPVKEALEHNMPLKMIYLAPTATGKIIDNIKKDANKQGISTKTIDKNNLQKLADNENHQGIVALMESLPTLDLDGFLEDLIGTPNPLLAILDGIEDPRNLGAILRVADAAGVSGVIIPSRRSASLSPGAIKSSAGAAFFAKVIEVPNLARAIDTLKKQNFWIAGTAMEDSKPAWEQRLDMPLAIVLGSESKGMHRLIRDKCDFYINLPMVGRVESLNVATAASAFFYEVMRQKAVASSK